jgi:O-acetyl-ADP-ribose deacetylase
MYYLHFGDITLLPVEAIVNPAHNSLIGKAGLSGYIQKKGGEKLIQKCDEHGELKTAEVFATYGYDLPAKHVIHTKGPMWLGGGSGELTKLEITYINILTLALERGFKELALPAIGTGLDGFPPREATQVALRVISNYLDGRESDLDIIFVCYNDDTLEAYREDMEVRGIEFLNYSIPQ